eukprot:scpid21624/ scgid16037/ Carbonic anhydrase 1; Carbonate dehydratase I; Carbonic anhydrase I
MITRLPAVTAVLAMFVVCSMAHDPWNTDYTSQRGPLFWGQRPEFKMCGLGREQSPINIRRSSTIYQDFPPLAFELKSPIVHSNIENKGSATAAFPLSDIPILSGGPLGNRKYRVYNVHLHFGNYSFRAAEHAFDGVRTTGEFHIVTYDSRYPHIKAALGSGRRGALAVLGVMFEARNVSNIDMGVTNLIELSSNVTYKGDHYMTGIDFSNLVSEVDMGYYYAYNGSLTTPTCNEVVQWMVIDRIHYVLPETADLLLELKTGYRREHSIPIFGNTRPLQPLYGRKVLRSFGPVVTDVHDQGEEIVYSSADLVGPLGRVMLLALAAIATFVIKA